MWQNTDYEGIILSLTRKRMSKMERHLRILEKLGLRSTDLWLKTKTHVMLPETKQKTNYLIFITFIETFTTLGFTCFCVQIGLLENNQSPVT